MLTDDMRRRLEEAKRRIFRVTNLRRVSQDGWDRASKYTAELGELLEDPQATDESAGLALQRLDQAIEDGALT